MLTDSIILLQLRAEVDGAIGDAQLRYTPTDPRYKVVRDHLPGRQVGKIVSVPPFG